MFIRFRLNTFFLGLMALSSVMTLLTDPARLHAACRDDPYRSLEVNLIPVRTAHLAGTRGRTLIVNLPGNPKAIAECLPLIAPAIREAIKHLHGG